MERKYPGGDSMIDVIKRAVQLEQVDNVIVHRCASALLHEKVHCQA